MQVCSGVRAMHRSSFAHRDIKPHNVLVRRHQTGESASLSNSSKALAGDTRHPNLASVSEAEPLQLPDAWNRSCYHAVLMVRPHLTPLTCSCAQFSSEVQMSI